MAIEHGYTHWLHVDDAQRIEGQNSADWGRGQKEYLQLLKAHGFQPKRMAELGVAPDATLVLNALEVFGDSLEELVVFELDEGRLAGAQQTIQKALADDGRFKGRERLPKIRYVQGDAGLNLQEEAESAKFDFIHSQLLLEHLLPQERRRLLQSVAGSLETDGYYAVADVAFGDWYTRANPPTPENTLGQQIAARDNAAIQTLRTRWSAVGKADFGTPKILADVVCNDAKRPEDDASPFELLPHFSRITMVDDFREGSPEMSFMQGMLERLHKDPQNPRPEDTAIEEALRLYSGDLLYSLNYVSHVYPSLVRQTFKRQ